MRLRPLILKPSYYTDIEAQINEIFWKVFYGPVKETFKKYSFRIVFNSVNEIRDALRDGRISFVDGQFVGQFNSKISKEFLKLGASFDKRSKSFRLPGNKIPPTISMAIAEEQMQFQSLSDALLKTINEAPIRLNEALKDSKIIEEYDKTVTEMDEAFKKTIKSVAIAPKLTPQATAKISKEWGQNLDLYIRKWTDENILALREQVQQNVYNGGRAAGLTKLIEKNYNVSKEKAKFLARQETSLLLSKFKQERYAEIGVQTYMWSGSMDERERHDHKVLEGKIFNFATPPITNRKTGATNNPGEDFNCRCVAIPIFEGQPEFNTKDEFKKTNPSMFKKIFDKK